MEMRIIEEGRQSMNNDGKIKQNRTTEAQQLDEGLKEMLLKDAGAMMLNKLHDRMAREGGPIRLTDH